MLVMHTYTCTPFYNFFISTFVAHNTLFTQFHKLIIHFYRTFDYIYMDIYVLQILKSFSLLLLLQRDWENPEYLKYFRNVYCVTTNHSKDQDMQASHKTTN